jgi:hypothetical protein
MIYETAEEAQAAVDAWNARYEPGQDVKFRFAHEPKPHRLAKTVGLAVVSGTSAMIALDKLPGGIGLGLIEPIVSDLA